MCAQCIELHRNPSSMNSIEKKLKIKPYLQEKNDSNSTEISTFFKEKKMF